MSTHELIATLYATDIPLQTTIDVDLSFNPTSEEMHDIIAGFVEELRSDNDFSECMEGYLTDDIVESILNSPTGSAALGLVAYELEEK